jgi:MioC protein
MMKIITLITGSTLGNAEYLAEHLSATIKDAGFMVNLLHGPTLTQLQLHGVWLVITSTHGAGELPDNLQPLFASLKDGASDLRQIQYGIIGLGDSSYDTFCQGAITADQQLSELGAQSIGQRLEIDMSSVLDLEACAEEWLQRWLMTLSELSC